MQVNSDVQLSLFLLYFHLLFFGGRPQATVKSQFLNNTHRIDNENICLRICTAQLRPENEICLFSILICHTYVFTSLLYWHTTESDRNFYHTLIKLCEQCSEETECDQEHLFNMLYYIHYIILYYSSTECRKLFKWSSRTMMHAFILIHIVLCIFIIRHNNI